MFATELIKVGDTKAVAASKQQFLLVNKEVGFSEMLADGIAGLPFSTPDGSKTLIETLYLNGAIPKRVFSLFLNNNQYENDDTRKPKSMLTIGGYDLQTYSDGSAVSQYNVFENNDGHWALKLDSIHCKDTDIDYLSEYAVLDSRSTKIVGPLKSVKKLFDRFEAMYGCGYYHSRLVCDCSEIYSIVQVPVITFNRYGDSYDMDQDQYFKKTSKVCYLMFEGADINYWILGQPFLRMYYSIYNLEDKTITLVNAAPSKFTTDTDSNWWIIPIVLLLGGAIWLFSWLGWIYYKRYSSDSKLLVEQEARE